MNDQYIPLSLKKVYSTSRTTSINPLSFTQKKQYILLQNDQYIPSQPKVVYFFAKNIWYINVRQKVQYILPIRKLEYTHNKRNSIYSKLKRGIYFRCKSDVNSPATRKRDKRYTLLPLWSCYACLEINQPILVSTGSLLQPGLSTTIPPTVTTVQKPQRRWTFSLLSTKLAHSLKIHAENCPLVRLELALPSQSFRALGCIR